MLAKEGNRILLGSKGFELYRCSLLGINVPEYTILTTECFRKCYRKVIDDNILDPLKDALELLGGRVAVRSSSVNEDLPDRSNAGMFKTFLNVVSIDEMVWAIKEVWASSNGSGMAVIIQKQIDPDLAGVLFTRNPLNGSNETVVEYVQGLGDHLVSGISDPLRIIFGKDGISEPEQYPDRNGDASFIPLINTSRFLESKFGYPLDIEWAYSMGEFHILQVRPITNLIPPNKDGSRTYSRVQAEQFYSGPVTPLFYSIFKRIFTEYYLKGAINELKLDIEIDDEFMIRHRNFLYVDTKIVEYALSRIGSRINIEQLKETVPQDLRDELRRTRYGSFAILFVKVLIFVLSNRNYRISKLDAFYRNKVVPEILASLHSLDDPHELSEKELIDHYQKLMELMEDHVTISKWGLALYSIPLMGAMVHILERKGYSRYLPDLISGFNENRTMDASQEINRLAGMAGNDQGIRDVLVSTLDDYGASRKRLKELGNGDRFIEYFENMIRMYGHRRISRDIYHPSWKDDPNIPFSIVRKLAFSLNKEDRKGNMDQIRRRKNDLVKRIRPSLSLRERIIFSTIMRYQLKYTEFRELQRFYLDMILAKFREFFLDISARMVSRGILDYEEDIFFLDIHSIMTWLEGSIGENLKTEARFNKLSFENETGIPGRYLRNGISFYDVPIEQERSDERLGRVISGQPVASGTHTGKTVVMKDLHNDPKLNRGDILVTRYIDPGQTHLFLMAGALILEVGGLLSHGAILAREFNIPTVAGVRDATEIFKDGQRAVVDGTKGTATILTEQV